MDCCALSEHVEII